MAKKNKTELITPREQAIRICDIVYHSAMGGGWHTFVVSRAKQIAEEIKVNTLLYCIPKSADKQEKYWDEVIAEIDKIKLK